MPKVPKIKAPPLIATANRATPQKGIAQQERESYGKPAFRLNTRKRLAAIKQRTGL